MRSVLVGVLAVGLLLRLWLVLVVFHGQGFAADMRLFVRWGDGLLQSGPSAFFESQPTANYPPVAIWTLGGLALAAKAIAGVTDASVQSVLAVLVKVPSVLADVASAALVFRFARHRAGSRAAVVAAALFLALPAVWYDSALWGQLDSLLILGSLGALALFQEGHSVLAGVVSVLSMSVKPQGLILVLVILVAGIAAEVRRPTGVRRRVRGCAAFVGGMLLTFLVVVVPFDYESLAPAGMRAVPLLGDVAGFVEQSIHTAGLFPVLTANAFNLWALLGDPSLAASIGSGGGWLPDSLSVLGVSAAAAGSVLLGVVVVVTLIALALRPDREAALGAFVVLSFAFFAFPTRSHERYLVPVFGVLAVLAAGSLLRWLMVLLVAAVNTVNLHAVLAGQLSSGGGAQGVTAVILPFAAEARQEWVVVACSVFQTAAAVAALVWFLLPSRRIPAALSWPRALGHWCEKCGPPPRGRTSCTTSQALLSTMTVEAGLSRSALGAPRFD